MKLWLHPNILYHSYSGLPEKGALYTCHLLRDNGYEIATNLDEILEPAAAIFSEEGIISEIEESKCEARISQNNNESFSLWIGEKQVSSGENLAAIYSSLVQPGSPIEKMVDLENITKRTATVQRKTNETDIYISLDLDGTGKSEISTGLKFFDHMLEQIARHGFVDLNIKCNGDLQVDEHHTIEDVAIALGEAIAQALGDKKGIERYAFVLPMDEARAMVALDLSGRPYLVFEGAFSREYVGDMPTEMVKHFFYSFAMHLKATLHIEFQGENDHHKIEAIFKSFARVLKTAMEKNPRIKNQIPSSKGAL
jgi:imidazoleglycerol phosphate dehydratase HisB